MNKEAVVPEKHVESKMNELLEKLPQLCPKVQRVESSGEVSNSRVEDRSVDINCFICNSVLLQKRDKQIHIMSDLTSRMTSVKNILNNIIKREVTEGSLCVYCYKNIDSYEQLHAELARLESDLVGKLTVSQKLREASFSFDENVLKQNGGPIWLNKVEISVLLNSEDENDYNRQAIDLRSSNLPTLDPTNISIPSLLPRVQLIVHPEVFSTLKLAMSVNGQPLVELEQLLKHSPKCALKSEVLVACVPLLNKDQSVSSGFHCQTCDFTTDYFHLLIPHLRSHESQSKDHIDTVKESYKMKCSKCLKVFKKKEVLEAHYKKVHQGVSAPWKCSYCGKGFTRKASLEEHVSRHKGEKQRYCDICDKQFYQTAYWRHVATVHPSKDKLKHQCPQCNKVFTLKFKLDIHMQSHMNHEEKLFFCEDCPDKRFASEEKLKNHKRSVHSKQEASHLCGECGASYSNYAALYQHTKRTHNYVAPSSQSDRLATVEDSTSLMSSPFLCGFDSCNEGFITIKHLQQHQLIHHKGAVEEDDQDENVIYVGNIHSDNEVEEDYGNLDNDTGQIKEVNTVMVVNESNEIGGYLDNFSKALESEDTLIKQESLSNIDVKNQDFSRDIVKMMDLNVNDENTIILNEDQGRELIKALQIEIVEGSEVYQCSICDKSYKSEKSRSIHLKTAHMNEKPFQCPECEKAFACQNYLSEHRKIHFSSDRFKCSLCNKSFSSNKVLKRHFRIHTGEKPFKCEYCQKTFAAASNLSEHRTLHTGRMPYSCTGCGGKFRLWTTLKKHTVKCDGIKPSGVKNSDDGNQSNDVLLDAVHNRGAFG